MHFENENMFLKKLKVINPFFLKEILKKLISILRMWTCIQILQVFMEEGVYPLGLKVTPVHLRQDTLVKQSQGEITAFTMVAQKLLSLSIYTETCQVLLMFRLDFDHVLVGIFDPF